MALARALVLNPDILLLDEPLSNLDAKIRIQVRAEIRRLQQELRITTIYVTHDQEEALSLSDRVAVMSDGRVLQVGPPEELYERPRTRFVADFVGTNNLVPGDCASGAASGDLVETRWARSQAVADRAAPSAPLRARGAAGERGDGGRGARPRRQRRGRTGGLASYLGNTLRYDVRDRRRARAQGRHPRSVASRPDAGGPAGDALIPALGDARPSGGPMTSTPPLPKLELAHAALSEEAALTFLAGHRISLGGRTMDPKAQIVGEFVKSIRVPGYYPPLPELRQQLRTMVTLMDEPAPALARVEDVKIPGPAGALAAPRLRGGRRRRGAPRARLLPRRRLGAG